MSSDSTNMDWLDKNSLKSVTARRFAEFCQKDMQDYNDPDDPDHSLYQEAALLILSRIEHTVVNGEKA